MPTWNAARALVALASIAVIVVGVRNIVIRHDGQAPPDVKPPAPAARVNAGPDPSPRAVAREGQAPTHSITLSQLPSGSARQPRRLSVPAEQISGPIAAVGTDPRTHLLRVPDTTTRIVWWAFGALPGDAHGSVVLAAHVDFNGKLGLFFNLDRVPIGALVRVALRDGRTTTYRVNGRQHVGKAQLARLGVFTRHGPPRLVLITCGGSFDAAKRSYRDNVVVTAHPVG
jgi:hypothetical protein